jgi:hypothetical protein
MINGIKLKTWVLHFHPFQIRMGKNIIENGPVRPARSTKNDNPMDDRISLIFKSKNNRMRINAENHCTLVRFI